MTVLTVEGIVENGKVQLPSDLQLPPHMKVYVVIPGLSQAPSTSVRSPRLADPSQMRDFTKQVEAE